MIFVLLNIVIILCTWYRLGLGLRFGNKWACYYIKNKPAERYMYMYIVLSIIMHDNSAGKVPVHTGVHHNVSTCTESVELEESHYINMYTCTTITNSITYYTCMYKKDTD